MVVQVGGSDVTVPSATLSLTSEEDEVVIPDGIIAISYTLIEDGESITRQIAVEPTDKVKYYKEEDGYYTLAVYGSDGAIKSKGYTLHSDDIPNIDIRYSADVNNNFTESDEYVEFVPRTVVELTLSGYNPTSCHLPPGLTHCLLQTVDNKNAITNFDLRDNGNDIHEVTVQRVRGTDRIEVRANGILQTSFYLFNKTYKYYVFYGTCIK